MALCIAVRVRLQSVRQTPIISVSKCHDFAAAIAVNGEFFRRCSWPRNYGNARAGDDDDDGRVRRSTIPTPSAMHMGLLWTATTAIPAYFRFGILRVRGCTGCFSGSLGVSQGLHRVQSSLIFPCARAAAAASRTRLSPALEISPEESERDER